MTHPLLNWENPIPSDLGESILVVALEGWIDAGFGAARAVGALKQQIRTQRLVAFECDELIDMRSRRPVMKLVNGVNTGLTWPRLQIRHGKDRLGQDILVLTGPEPDHRWRAFTAAIMDVVEECNVRMCVGLGAFPAPVPHTRPVTLGSTATSEDLAQRVGFLPASFEIPAGASAAIERAFAEVDKPAVGIWARVPHYVAAMPFPAASASILDALARVTGLVIDTDELHRDGRVAVQQIEQLVSNNPEHIAMVRNLERQADSENEQQLGGAAPFTDASIPTGDELAAELEKFLREQ